MPNPLLLRWGPPRPLRGDAPKSQEVGGHEGSTWCHHACDRLLKGTTTTMVIAVEKSKKAVTTAKVTVTIRGELAFHRAIAKKNKGRLSSVTIDTLRLGLSMTAVKNKSGPKPYHSNPAVVAMHCQNTRFVRTCHSDSC